MSRPAGISRFGALAQNHGGLCPNELPLLHSRCSTITLILMTMKNPAAQLREKLNARAVIGTFLKLGRREVIEILAIAGLDFVICDLEHSQITEQEAGNMITAGRACDLPVIVRLAHFDPGQVNRLLEAGAAGIQLP